jgi:FkbM family methyltransferase
MSSNPKYHGQVLQDKFLNEVLFQDKRDGFFVDVGAHDGLTISNTLFFERELGWRGICIEPLPNIFCQLVQNRGCDCLRGCAYHRNGFLPFSKISGYAEMLSGLRETHPEAHRERITRELQEFGGSEEIINVRSFRLEDVFDLFNVRKVSYLSVDTEGAELQVLQGINFHKVLFDAIQCEVNYPEMRAPIEQLLTPYGYLRFAQLEGDDLYVRQELLALCARNISASSFAGAVKQGEGV